MFPQVAALSFSYSGSHFFKSIHILNMGAEDGVFVSPA